MWADMTGASTPVEVILQNGSTVAVNVTENPTQGDIEEWSIYNFTEDAHPIHLHLVRFEVVSRGDIEDFPIAAGAGVEPWETGFKDTVIAYPDQITTVKAKFDITGLYVWHCHIVEHEDNEMMRPYVVSAEE
jgi:FtsP/CotA-like multicopper oxidase with cupredoxin domain